MLSGLKERDPPSLGKNDAFQVEETRRVSKETRNVVKKDPLQVYRDTINPGTKEIRQLNKVEKDSGSS